MTKLPLALGLFLLSVATRSRARQSSDSVVLLHGLGRGPWSMMLLEWRLAGAGYRVHNLAYPRRADSIEAIVAEVHRLLSDCCVLDTGEVHFVTHSLGGLVLRAYLAKHRPRKLGRAVMLAPPNGGSEIVDRFRDWSLFCSVLGPIAPQLGTGPDDLPARFPIPDCEFGVIAGSHWINPVGPMFLPSPHDGTVSVNRTYLSGMADHLIVPYTHTFIMNSKLVARQVIYFLGHGKFERRGKDAA